MDLGGNFTVKGLCWFFSSWFFTFYLIIYYFHLTFLKVFLDWILAYYLCTFKSAIDDGWQLTFRDRFNGAVC